MADIPEVTPDDLAVRYEGDLLSEFSEDYVAAKIEDAVDEALTRWRAQIQSRLASGLLTTNGFRRVIAEAVLRVLRNPDNKASENELGYGYALRTAVAPGEWFNAADERALTGVDPNAPSLPRTVGVRIDAGWG